MNNTKTNQPTAENLQDQSPYTALNVLSYHFGPRDLAFPSAPPRVLIHDPTLEPPKSVNQF